MKHVLLAMSSVSRAGAAPEIAVEKAAALGAELLALYVIDDRSTRGVDRRLADSGFVGEKPVADTVAAIESQFRRMADQILARVRRACEERGVPYGGRVASGRFVDATLQSIRRGEPVLCIVPSERRSRVARWLRRDDAQRLMAQEGIELLVVDVDPEDDP